MATQKKLEEKENLTDSNESKQKQDPKVQDQKQEPIVVEAKQDTSNTFAPSDKTISEKVTVLMGAKISVQKSFEEINRMLAPVPFRERKISKLETPPVIDARTRLAFKEKKEKDAEQLDLINAQLYVLGKLEKQAKKKSISDTKISRIKIKSNSEYYVSRNKRHITNKMLNTINGILEEDREELVSLKRLADSRAEDSAAIFNERLGDAIWIKDEVAFYLFNGLMKPVVYDAARLTLQRWNTRTRQPISELILPAAE